MGDRGWVVAGLGNPGSRYAGTRHNAGFLLLDALVSSVAPQARWRTQFKGETLAVTLGADSALLLKPQTYMNLSGESVQECLAFQKVAPAQLIVVHDEIDLPFGTLRIKKGGGSGGHNGLKSITEMLSTPDYFRIRIGIGRPGELAADAAARHQDVSSYVLAPFSAEERRALDDLFKRASAALETLIKSGLAEAQRLHH